MITKMLCYSGKWIAIEKSIQYLRELAMLEVIYDEQGKII